MINQNENLNPEYQLKRFYVSTDSDEIFRQLTKGKTSDSQQRGFENQFASLSPRWIRKILLGGNSTRIQLNIARSFASRC